MISKMLCIAQMTVLAGLEFSCSLGDRCLNALFKRLAERHIRVSAQRHR